MEIRKLEKKNDKGELEVSFALSEQQTQILLEFAINYLVGQGLVTFCKDAVQSMEDNKPSPQQMEIFLDRADPKDLPQA